MRLIECHIENFGRLSDFHLSFHPECAVICEENGWGKSTLAAFIKAMFYGFSNERSRDEYLNERKRFRPWQGGVYGGSLVFEAGGREYEVTRTFGSREKEDRFFIRYRSTNQETGDYTKNLGEELFSLDKDSFERTVFLTQNDCVTEATDRIYERIGNLAYNQEESNQFDDVIRRLNQLINAMTPDRKTGRLYQRKEKIAEAQMKLARGKHLDERIRKLQEQKTEYKSLYGERKLEQKRITEEKKQVRALLKEQIRTEQQLLLYTFTEEEKRQYQILNQLLCEQGTDKETILKVFYEEDCFAAMREPDKLEKSKEKDPAAFLMTGLGGVMVLAGILWQYLKGSPGNILTAVGVMITIFSALMFQVRKRQQQVFEKDLLFQRIWNLLEGAHEDLTEKYMQYQLAAKNQKNSVSMESLDDRLDEIFGELEMLARESAELERSLDELSAERQELYELEEKVTRWKKQLKKEEEQYRHLKLTRDFLLEAKASFASKYVKPLRIGFEKYYEILTGEKAEDFYLNTDLELTKKEQAEQRELRFFSAGYRDLTGLCMRMALVDAMYREEKPFVILDDPFVNLDKEKMKGAQNLLSGIRKQYQVIYFTCHESRKLADMDHV